MNKKILIVIIILVILCIGIVGAIFAVNLGVFQSEKKQFFKYMKQNAEILEMFTDEELSAYEEKQQNTPYTSEGNVSLKISDLGKLLNAIQQNDNSNQEYNNDYNYYNEQNDNNEPIDGTDESEQNDSDNDYESNLYNQQNDGNQSTQPLSNYTNNQMNQDMEFKIKFDGKVDNKNKKAQQNIKLHYTDDVYFPIEYRRIGDSFGITSPEVVTSYVVVKNSNLKQFARALGITDTTEIPDSINLEKKGKIEFSEEEKKTLKERYSKILSDNLVEEQFTQRKENDMNIYEMTMTEKQFDTLYRNILTQVKQDEIITSKLDDVYEGYKDKFIEFIDEMLEEIDIENVTDKVGMTISLYVQNGKLIKTEIKIEEAGIMVINKNENGIELEFSSFEDNETQKEAKVVITKQKYSSNIDYTISASIYNEEEEIQAIIMNIGYSGIESLYTVKETFSIEIPVYNGKFSYENEKQFADSIEIEEFNSENSLTINELDNEKISLVLQTLIQKVVEVNSNKFAEIANVQ